MEKVLTDGKVVIYSPEDHELISKYSWFHNQGYCKATVDGKKGTMMHRFLMNATNDQLIDHINGNKLDNRRENLQVTNVIRNGQNKKKRKNASSKYYGVTYKKSSGKYMSRITDNGNEIFFGYYHTEYMAAVARDMYIIHELPDSAYPLNFPKIRDYFASQPYTHVNRRDKSKIAQKDKAMYECTDTDEIIRLLIPSNPNLTVLIDTEDYEKIRHLNWCISSSGYVFSGNIRLHRLVMDQSDPKIFVDHIDGNKLNNTKNNLKISNIKLNGQNKTKRKNTSSKYQGVSLSHTKTRWIAVVHYQGKDYRVGSFEDEEIAAEERDLYILKHFPDSNFKLNFPINTTK